MENDLYSEICETARLLDTYGTLMYKENSDTDLEPREYRILRLLQNNAYLSQQDISSVILITKAHAGFILSSLEQKGYIERKNGKKNGKAVKISLVTQKGIDEYNRVTLQIENFLTKIENGIPPKRKQTMLKDLKKIRSEIEKYAGKLY